MPRYLVQANLTVDGAKGMLASGGSARKRHLAQVAKGLGGKLESFYYAFGDTDVFAIFELPDNVTAAALTLTVSASGAVVTRTTVLITPDEVDEAIQKQVPYKPPGS
jgi:uncharacterized protein with GYD domain